MKKWITKSVFAGLVLLALGFISLASFGQNKMKIAVMDFKAAVGVNQNEVSGLSDMLINSLYETGKFTIIERYQLDKILKEQGFQSSDITTEQVVKVGKVLGVAHILVGTVNSIMGEYNIDVRIVSVESGQIVSTAGVTKTTNKTFRTMMPDLAAQIVNKMSGGASVSSNSSSQTASAVQLYKQAVQYKNTGNYDEAVNLFTQSAEMGYAKSQHELAELCVNKKVDGYKNYTLAFKWWKKAAEQGVVDAQYKVGLCYFGGDGVGKNSDKAKEWFYKAAQQGHAEAQYKYGLWYAGSEELKWLRKAAEQGHVDAQCQVGYKVRNGDEAVKWFRMAAEQGNVYAQYKLGMLLYYGNIPSATKGYRLKDGTRGTIYFCSYGSFAKQDPNEGMKWLQKAAAKGNEEAKGALNTINSKREIIWKYD